MSLCDRCNHGLIYERANGASVYRCTFTRTKSGEVPPDIVKCSKFEDQNRPALWDMREIAWTLEVGANGRIKGFKQPTPQD